MENRSKRTGLRSGVTTPKGLPLNQARLLRRGSRRADSSPLDVVFQGPDTFDRGSVDFRNSNGLFHEVTVGRTSPPKSAARRHGVEANAVRIETRRLGCSLSVHGLKLRSNPNLARVGADVRNAVQRLHRRVS